MCFTINSSHSRFITQRVRGHGRSCNITIQSSAINEHQQTVTFTRYMKMKNLLYQTAIIFHFSMQHLVTVLMFTVQVQYLLHRLSLLKLLIFSSNYSHSTVRFQFNPAETGSTLSSRPQYMWGNQMLKNL